MEILKIIFQHDMTLEHLSGHDDPRNHQANQESTLESFLRPQKTYNRYYFTGTNIVNPITATRPGSDVNKTSNHDINQHSSQKDFTFGLNTLSSWIPILSKLEHLVTPATDNPSRISDSGWYHTDGSGISSLGGHLDSYPLYHSVFLFGREPDAQVLEVARHLRIDDQTGIREKLKPLTTLLDDGYKVLLTEKAHHGIDLHLFTIQNLYENIFEHFKSLISPNLRYFSINGKRVGSERHFYFETWCLERPPHGFQEVTSEARIR